MPIALLNLSYGLTHFILVTTNDGETKAPSVTCPTCFSY